MLLQLIGQARLLANWSAENWGDRKKSKFRFGQSDTRHDLRVPNTGSHWRWERQYGTRQLERVADTWPPGASSGQTLQKKGHILTVPISQCPKDEFDAASLKRAVDGNGPF